MNTANTPQPALPGEFETLTHGTHYELPKFTVVEGVGLVDTGQRSLVTFVRGSKLKEEKVVAVDGITHESLIAMQIQDLKYKYGLVPSEETRIAIVHLESALEALNSRSKNRAKAGVLGTYKQ